LVAASCAASGAAAIALIVIKMEMNLVVIRSTLCGGSGLLKRNLSREPNRCQAFHPVPHPPTIRRRISLAQRRFAPQFHGGDSDF
jgi:hypothetical protein